MQDADLDRPGLRGGRRERRLDAADGGKRGGGSAETAEAAAGKPGVQWCHQSVPCPFSFVARPAPRITIAMECNSHATNL